MADVELPSVSIAKHIFELQQIETAIQSAHEQLEKTKKNIEHNDAFEQAKRSLETTCLMLSELEKQYRQLDMEAEELRKNIKGIEEQMYGGKIKNPKELMNYEQEAELLKAKLGKMDDKLLELMERIEASKDSVAALKKAFDEAQTTWDSEKATLQQKAAKFEEELASLEAKHKDMLREIDSDSLSLYKSIRERRGQAVAKVEQGKCMGCHYLLSVSELQRVRGSSIVQCNNCGRILYLS